MTDLASFAFDLCACVDQEQCFCELLKHRLRECELQLGVIESCNKPTGCSEVFYHSECDGPDVPDGPVPDFFRIVDKCLHDDPTYCEGFAVCDHDKCDCKAGYVRVGETCKDNNECKNETVACDTNADCYNSIGSYKCTCKTGYQGDGNSCTDTDECAKDDGASICHKDAVCNNTIGSYTCKCKPGFSGNGQICVDRNECKESKNADCDTDAVCKILLGVTPVHASMDTMGMAKLV